MLLEDSTTYQMILEKGRMEGLSQGINQGLNQGLNQGMTQGRVTGVRETLLLLGAKRFGLPRPAVAAELDAIKDVNRLTTLVTLVMESNTWEDLLSNE